MWTVFAILLILWAVGLVTDFGVGNFIHILLVAAVVVLVLQFFSRGAKTP